MTLIHDRTGTLPACRRLPEGLCKIDVIAVFGIATNTPAVLPSIRETMAQRVALTHPQ